MPRVEVPALLRTGCRLLAATAIVGIGAVHVVWSSGRPWPARSDAALADAVVGGVALPSRAASAVVGTALVAAGVAVGRGGRTPVWRTVRGLITLALLGRAAVGGAPAARALGVREPSATFRRLDARVYRPLCAVVGAATALTW